jgi:VWFA-related protein
VQVLDKQGNFVSGLKAADFTLLEEGRPQKIAFFGAEQQPASIAILLDSSRSMDFSRKFNRARELLAPLFAGHRPNDEIYFMPFDDRVEAFTDLTPEQRLHPASIGFARLRNSPERGTALYDALASALCRMRTATNLLQAVVVITDGADQHSRLNLEQLIALAQMSNPQIFMIGFFGGPEYQVYRQSKKTVTLIGEHDIDNPLFVFDRLAKESGAESFFPSSEQDLRAAIDRISRMLEAQYTLAYYPENVDRSRKIEVRVRRRGVKVIARSGVGSQSGGGPVHFQASTCEVSAADHPYPWELKTTQSLSGLVYREDFSDPTSGWPNRREKMPSSRRDRYQPGLLYAHGGYQISRNPPPNLISTGPITDGTVAAYGPSWDDFRASVSVASDWERTTGLQHTGRYEIAAGLIFHLNDRGYDALLLSGGQTSHPGERPQKFVQFKLEQRMFSGDGPDLQSDLVPWTPVASADGSAFTAHTISLAYKQGEITVFVDDHQVAGALDDTLAEGLIGLGFFGRGSAVFRDLQVQDSR